MAKTKEQIMEEMNAAGDEARDELKQLIAHGGALFTATDLAAWMRRWYMRAGYKRLSKIILEEL